MPSSNLTGRFLRHLRSTARAQSENAKHSENCADPGAGPFLTPYRQQTAGSGFELSSDDLLSSSDPYAFLSKFDTAFLIDDSSSMTSGTRWEVVKTVLYQIVPVCDAGDTENFGPAPRQKKNLWGEGEPIIARPKTKGIYSGRDGSNGQRKLESGPSTRGLEPSGQSPGEAINRLLKQPETRLICQDQLIAEVKGIYSGLVMVESRCINVDSAQTSLQDGQDTPKLTDDQWQALISLHRAFLHEHHDFFLASQHPSAGPTLRRLASKYAMPARVWRHGIHSFLELLRHRLPASSEYMLSFIYLAYSMMALLYETVPAFEDTWIECLGDLSRYRMAIEDDDVHDRNVWTAVSRSWYSKASDKAPTTGRLHHHLAILACQPGLPCFPQSAETPEAWERDQGLLKARLTAQSMLGGAGDEPSVPEDWKLRGALRTETAFLPGLETTWNLLLPIKPLSCNPVRGPNMGSTLLLASRVALALVSTATGRAHGSPCGPKRQLLVLAALILLASSPAAAAVWMGEQTRAALNALCTTVAFGSAVGVVGVSTYGPDVAPEWPISTYVCWAVSFVAVVVGALLRQPTAMRRKALACVTLMVTIHIYGLLFAQGSSPVSNLVTFGPVVLVASLFVATVLTDLSPAIEIVRGTLGA